MSTTRHDASSHPGRGLHGLLPECYIGADFNVRGELDPEYHVIFSSL